MQSRILAATFALITLLSSTPPARADMPGYSGSIAFTEAEKRRHEQGLKAIMETASACLEEDLSRHADFVRRFGISAFYGDNSSFAKKKIKRPDGSTAVVATTDDDKRAHLRRFRLDESLIRQLIPPKACPRGIADCPLLMQPTSCIGLSLKCLGNGFQAAGQGELWQRLYAFTKKNNARGDALQMGLQQLGWQLVYWNPDFSKAREWDREEQARYPGNPKNIWGQHEASLRSVLSSRHKYLYETVDDWSSLVNFGATVPARIQQVPFFVGIAHLGYHVFPGSYGRIIEGHSTRQISDAETLQTSPFSPLMEGGGPRGGPYKTGLVAIPPGY
jgi:hypothetical protein